MKLTPALSKEILESKELLEFLKPQIDPWLDTPLKGYVDINNKVKGKYGIIPFNITLRKVSRDSKGMLWAEGLPDNSLVRKAMQKLISKESGFKTEDGWLKIGAKPEQINAALAQLHQNKGSKATLELDGGVDITLELIQP